MHPPPTSLLPQTPFTPFAPLATAAAASFSSSAAYPEILIPEPDLGDTAAPLADTGHSDASLGTGTDGAGGGDALVGLYNKILRFVQRDVMGVIHIVESVLAKSRRGGSAFGLGGISPGGLGISPGGLPLSSSMGASSVVAKLASGADSVVIENPERVEIMANVVWAELARALMDELGSSVFAVGRPDEFRQVIVELLIFCSTHLTNYKIAILELHNNATPYISARGARSPSIGSCSSRPPVDSNFHPEVAATGVLPVAMERYNWEMRRRSGRRSWWDLRAGDQ